MGLVLVEEEEKGVCRYESEEVYEDWEDAEGEEEEEAPDEVVEEVVKAAVIAKGVDSPKMDMRVVLVVRLRDRLPRDASRPI